MHLRLIRVVASLVAALTACGGERVATPDNVCAPGQQIECVCSNAAKGAQACRADGSGYEPCVCTGGTAGAGGSSGAGAASGAGGGAGSGGSAGSGGGSNMDAMPPSQDVASGDTSDSGPTADADRPDTVVDASIDTTIADIAEDVGMPPTDGPPKGDGGCLPALYLMIDNSGSMDMIDNGQTATRWDNLTQAIPTFVNDPANAGMMVGVDFFPEGGNTPSCNVVDYTMANVGIDVIPGVGNTQSNAIIGAIAGRARGGGTPTTQALTGGLQTAKAWQVAHAERSLGLLFLTDGQPTGCVAEGNTVMAAAMVAQAYATDTPPIKTFVLGIGPDTGNLDMIAAAGGTTKAYMVTTSGSSEVLKALATIATSVCGP